MILINNQRFQLQMISNNQFYESKRSLSPQFYLYNNLIAKTEMLSGNKKQGIPKLKIKQSDQKDVYQQQMEGNQQFIQKKEQSETISNYSKDQRKNVLSYQIKSTAQNQHIVEQDIETQRIIDLKKVDQIQQQEREIERVAEQLITLKQVIKKLKISIGIMIQQEIHQSSINYANQQINQNYIQSQIPLQKALRKLQKIQDRRITPEYKEWISQYFNKIFNDVKQIKTQFMNYQKAKKKSQNTFDLSQSKVTLNGQRSYQNLIQYQIKCKLLQCVLKLCRSKGIFSSADYIKYSNELQIVSNGILQQNLQKYKMNNICQKVKNIKKSGPQQLFYQWKTIHDELQIVNLQEIQRFYKQKKQLSYLNSYENNENGILIIGGSGVGKTTLFLSMAGQKMIKKKIKSRNSQFQNYQAADQQIANQYKTSPFSTSCTRQPAKLEAPKKYAFPQQLCLIDTAGFQESRSGQIDIMNTLYTYQTIQQMKKLRIIIVISQKNIGERDQGLNKFAKNIARYFRDYEEVRESILFVLTKFDNAKKLKIACDNLLKTICNHKETNQYRFIKHLQQSIIYKQVVQFRPTDENILFDAQYHIDPVEMDGKLKKLYKSLLKRFPIHHQYENDYINLEYSRQTKDKLIQKKCYLQNMIRKLYKQGNNNFRFYLQQLMFLQNKINKIQYHHKLKYANQNQNTFDILSFIQQINQQVLTKFSNLLQDYFNQCNPQTLKRILQLKNRYSTLFLGNVDVMVQNTEILQEDYQYIFQQITQSINSLKVEFDKIVDQKHKNIGKTMKFKPKWCHDIKNKKWLCAVMNFTRQYFNQGSDFNLVEEQEKQNDPKAISNNQGKTKRKSQQVGQNKQYRMLMKTIKKNEQKFRQQFSEQLNIMDQQITNFLVKKSIEANVSNDFLVQTQKQIYETYNNFKKLVFITQMLESKNDSKQIEIPSDEKIFNYNLQYIVSILKLNLDKQFQDICQNIQLMNIINHNLKDSDHDISRNVFLEVERYSQKIKMYYSCDKQIYDLMQTFYNKVMRKVNVILKQINQNMFAITKKQSQDQIKIAVDFLSSNKQQLMKKIQKLNSNILYCYLSKINQIQQFAQIKKQMQFQVRCFNIKLHDYVINLQKYFQRYDQKLSLFKNIVKKQKKSGKSMVSLQLYSLIKNYIEQCTQIQHQIKLIHHYFRNQDTKENLFKFQHLSYIKSIFYRHSRFLQCQKRSIRDSYQLTQKLQRKEIPLDLIIDYVILEEIYIQKIKFDDSNEFKKLHNAYENSYQSKIQFVNEFQDMKTHELKMLNECKHRILDKLIQYPYELETVFMDKIESEEFQLVFDSQPIKKTLQIFLYYIQMKQVFEDIDALNNEQISHDFRVIQLSDMSSPIQTIQENIETLSNLIVTITQIANLKYVELKQVLSQVILDDFHKTQIINYLKGCHLLCHLFDKLQISSLEGYQLIEEALENFKRKNLFNQIKQFVDKSQSIFYRLSKNIDSIQLQHFQNISEVLEKPQSTKEFLKILKTQCSYFIEALQSTDFDNLANQVLLSLKDLLKKMDQSQNQMDFLWEQQIKELQKSSKDPKNSLHKLIKLYQQNISKVSTQKTLQYRFVQLKRQQLANEIKQFLNQPGQSKVQKGQALCEQLKNYLNFLKSMKFKMVVNLNGIDEIKNIQQMQRIYEKEATKSQAQKSQTDMTPSQLRQNLLSIDYVQRRRQNSQRYSISDVKTSNFGGVEQRQKQKERQKPIQRKSALRRSQIWQEKSNGTSGTNQTPKRNAQMDNSFSSIVDDWSKQMAVNTMDGTHNIHPQMIKSQSGVQIRTKKLQVTASTPNIDMTKSNIDNQKRYTINGPINQEPTVTNMKKSSINLKNSPPPTLSYQNSLKKNTQPSIQENLDKLGVSDSTPSLLVTPTTKYSYPNYPGRMIPKHKTDQKITY